MTDRQITQQTITSLLGKLRHPDSDLRYMSLNDLFGVLTSPQSTFISSDQRSAKALTDGLLLALDDQHGDVQNMALKWYVMRLSGLTPKRLTNTPVSAHWLSDCR